MLPQPEGARERELYDFAVHRLADMLEELRAGYYADSFPV
jgi:hypothetical protein